MSLIYNRHRSRKDKKLDVSHFNPFSQKDRQAIPITKMSMLKAAFKGMKSKGTKARRHEGTKTRRDGQSEQEKAKRRIAFLAGQSKGDTP